MKQNPTEPPVAPRVRFEQVDVLRGFAALTVVFSHYIPFWERYLGNIWVLVPNSFGSHAVKLFFIISGLVIFMTLDKCRSVFEFAVLRFSRLYPAYWTSLGLSTFIGVVIFGDNFWPGGLVANITMFQEFIGSKNFDEVYWSLTVELAFYLNVAWLFALGFHKRPLTCITAWLCLSAIWAVTLHVPGSDVRGWLAIFLALDYAAYFSIGILFYNTRGRQWTPAEFTILIAALVTEYLVASWEGLAVAVVSTTLVYAALSGYLKILTNRFTLWLGAISYSLYLIHRNIGYKLLPWFHDLGLDVFAAISVTTLLILGLAAAITFWVERPASRLIRSKMKS